MIATQLVVFDIAGTTVQDDDKVYLTAEKHTHPIDDPEELFALIDMESSEKVDLVL